MTELKHSYELFKQGCLGKIRNPILKCPVCKRKRQFEAVDVNCSEGHVYINGNYGRLICCEKCKIVLGMEEEDLK